MKSHSRLIKFKKPASSLLLICWLGVFTGIDQGFGEEPVVETALPLKLQLYPNRMQELFAAAPAVKPAESSGSSSSNKAGSPVSLTAPVSYTSLTGVTGLRVDAAVGSSSGTDYVLDNLRIASNQTTFDDYLIGSYSFDLPTQRLVPVSFLKYGGVGIYDSANKLLIKDNISTMYFYTSAANTTQYPEGSGYTFQSSTDYFINTSVGHSLQFIISGLTSRTIRIVLTDTQNAVVTDQRLTFPSTAGSFFVATGVPIFLDGPYRFRVEPVSPATAFSYTYVFSNANGTNVATAVSGTTLSASFSGRGLSYKKYKIRLTSGQSITTPLDADINQILLNSKGVVMAGPTNAGINLTVTDTDDYYLVLQPYDSLSNSTESYSGVLTITTPLSFIDWTFSHRLHPDRDGPLEDANGDGVPNLVSYALGTDPAKSMASPIVFTTNATTMSLTFPAANYATNVTFQPEFSTALGSWSATTPVNSGSVEGATIMSASFARNGSRGFGHLKMTLGP